MAAAARKQPFGQASCMQRAAHLGQQALAAVELDGSEAKLLGARLAQQQVGLPAGLLQHRRRHLIPAHGAAVQQ
jgi:hypothetical protein